MQQLQLSARAFHRVLKIARTIADLAGSDDIAQAEVGQQHIPRAQLGDDFLARVLAGQTLLRQFNCPPPAFARWRFPSYSCPRQMAEI